MTQADPNPMDAAEPQAQPGKKHCGAKLRKKPGKRCRNTLLMPNGRCRLHGGKTPSGLASKNWKHGLRSRAHRWQASLPAGAGNLGDRFDAALKDPSLASLRQALALNDALVTSYMATMKATGRAVTPTQEKRILNLLDSQRKLAGDEARRMRDLGAMVGREQFLMVVGVCTALFVEFIPDLKARAEVQRRLQQALLTAGQRVLEGGD